MILHLNQHFIFSILADSQIDMNNEPSLPKMLYDFREINTLNKWNESSDTVRVPGMSKASFVIQVST